MENLSISIAVGREKHAVGIIVNAFKQVISQDLTKAD